MSFTRKEGDRWYSGSIWKEKKKIPDRFGSILDSLTNLPKYDEKVKHTHILEMCYF